MHREEMAPAKDFKNAIKRLFHELKPFHILISISFILAIVGSILSIVAPSKLTSLTDTITDGIIIRKDNLTELTNTISKLFTSESMSELMPKVLSPKLDNETISKVMMSKDITSEAKKTFSETLTSISTTHNYEDLTKLDEKILKLILPDTTYEGVPVSTSDKIALLNISEGNINLTPNLQKIFLPDITIANTLVTSAEQYKFVESMNSLGPDASSTDLYRTIDDMPDSIKSIVNPIMDMDKIKNIVIFLVILYLCSAIFSFLEALIMTHVSNKFAYSLRDKISKKIHVLPLKYFDLHAVGDTLSRVTNDVDTIAQSMNQSLSTLVSSITLLLGTIIMMFVTNPILAITAIVSSVLGFMGMVAVLSKSQKYFVARQTELGNLNGHIEEIYSGLNVVKAYNAKEEADKTFDMYNERVQKCNEKSQFLSGLMMPMMSFIGNFGYVAVCIVGALLTMNGSITFGVIIAFITYVRLFTSPLSQIAQAATSMQSTAAASERVFEFLDEEEMPFEENKEHLNLEDVKGNITFKDVTFTYDGNTKPTITNFQAEAKRGQKIAIVGPTGAGKTTMVNLLMKFYDIDSGDILIDGVSTKDLTRENIHSLFTMVLQDTWLFEGTIKENIIYNREGISDEEVHNVCKKIGLDHFIRTLPDGYDTIISENDSVSQGQRQLLTIARSMLSHTPFLILDEATSNVDTRTEELVQSAMDKLTEGKTSFIIAHRLSTIRNADLILVMKDGNIIETGNHDELMNKNGFYAKLYNSQFEL